MEFYATDYDEHTYVYLSYQGAPLDQRDGGQSSTFWWPLSSHSVTVNAVITPGGACDYGVAGHTVHHIWNAALTADGSMMKWQDKMITTDKALVSQPPCQPPDTTVVSGSSGGYDDTTDPSDPIYVICYWTNYYEDGVLIEHEDDGCQVLG